MGTMNKVILIGRLGKDPEERTTAGGTRVSNFSLATDTYHGSNGEKTTEWHRIVVFGKIAEQCNQYLQKGQAGLHRGFTANAFLGKIPGRKTLFHGCRCISRDISGFQRQQAACSAGRRKNTKRNHFEREARNRRVGRRD